MANAWYRAPNTEGIRTKWCPTKQEVEAERGVATYLLSLLDGCHGVRLELQLVCAAQLPVEDGDDEDHHEQRNHHPDGDPHVGVLFVGGRRRHLLYSCRKTHQEELNKFSWASNKTWWKTERVRSLMFLSRGNKWIPLETLIRPSWIICLSYNRWKRSNRKWKFIKADLQKKKEVTKWAATEKQPKGKLKYFSLKSLIISGRATSHCFWKYYPGTPSATTTTIKKLSHGSFDWLWISRTVFFTCRGTQADGIMGKILTLSQNAAHAVSQNNGSPLNVQAVQQVSRLNGRHPLPPGTLHEVHHLQRVVLTGEAAYRHDLEEQREKCRVTFKPNPEEKFRWRKTTFKQNMKKIQVKKTICLLENIFTDYI